MNPWLLVPALALIAAVFVVVPIAVTTFVHWRRPWRLVCPRENSEAQIKVAAARAAVAALVGRAPAIDRCSLWSTVRECREECLALPVDAMRRMRRGDPPPSSRTWPGLHTIIVPLDGSLGSERILDAVADLARQQAATLRFVHVVRDVPAATTAVDGRAISFVDEAYERVEADTRTYFRSLAARLPGVAVEGAVRFGDPVTEIVDEAESAGADLIAMASHRRTALFRRSIARRLERETTIPILLVPYGTGRSGVTNIHAAPAG
jgi:nucleotide-binding universal stress UspA family protein